MPEVGGQRYGGRYAHCSASTCGPGLALSRGLHVGAAKAGVDNMMKNLALEWGKYGIRSNSIVPGPIAGTEGVKRLGGEAWEKMQHKTIPLGRYGTVEEIGNAAAFLASPLAAYVTGTVLVVDGGQNLFGSAPFGAAIEGMMGKA